MWKHWERTFSTCTMHLSSFTFTLSLINSCSSSSISFSFCALVNLLLPDIFWPNIKVCNRKRSSKLAWIVIGITCYLGSLCQLYQVEYYIFHFHFLILIFHNPKANVCKIRILRCNWRSHCHFRFKWVYSLYPKVKAELKHVNVVGYSEFHITSHLSSPNNSQS